MTHCTIISKVINFYRFEKQLCFKINIDFMKVAHIIVLLIEATREDDVLIMINIISIAKR